jgi:LacI family transcriptional regulator, galactose operon repressor
LPKAVEWPWVIVDVRKLVSKKTADNNSAGIAGLAEGTRLIGAGRSGVATIHDVADRAGVSIKTVSRVVNREPNVRDEMMRRVQQAITELNYRPNFSARNLAGRKAYLVALIYDNPSDSYLAGVQAGALRSCHELGYSLLLQPCRYDQPEFIDEVLTLVRERRPSGLVLTPPVCDLPALQEVLDANNVDYVCMGSVDDARARFPVVRSDDLQGAYDLTAYLLNLGHRRIAFIQGHPAHVSARARVDGFLRAHREFGVAVNEQLILQGMFTFDSAVECARRLLAQPQRPSAVFAANDDMAAGVLHVAHEMGISVPAQLSVAGFDDVALARCVWPSLTTVRQPIKEMAELAVDVLIKVAAERARGIQGERRVEVLCNELIIRDSTAAPASPG